MRIYAYNNFNMSTGNFAKGIAGRPAMNEATIHLVATRFAALAEPMRLRLIHALFEGERTVTDLVRVTGATQTNVSRHLQTLAHANILTRRKEGQQVFYAIADPSIGLLCEVVCGTLKQQLTSQVQAIAG